MRWKQLPAGLGEGQIAKFAHDDEVEPGQVIGDTPLPAGASFGLQLIDEIDDIVETATQAGADRRPGDGDGQMRLSGAGSTEQNGVTLIGSKGAAGECEEFRACGPAPEHNAKGRRPSRLGPKERICSPTTTPS